MFRFGCLIKVIAEVKSYFSNTSAIFYHANKEILLFTVPLCFSCNGISESILLFTVVYNKCDVYVTF